MDQSSLDKGFKQFSILDLIELDGDEDDDEYNPAEEEEVEDEEEELVEDLFLGESMQLSQAQSQSQQLSNETSDVEMSESDMIARRTRSKFQIEEEPRDTLEFPDVTKDLYEEAMVEDDEWSIFLKALFQDDPSKLLDEDETNNDPDYEFEDVNEIIRRETGGILADYSSIDLTSTISGPSVEKIDMKSISSTDLSEWSKYFTKEDIELLYHQMSQHVQLLAQHYLLTATSSTLGHIAENTAFLLREIHQFGKGKEVSLFQAPNLPGALKILEDHPIAPSNIKVIANSWRQCPVPLIVRPIIAANPRVFCYHELLPQTGYPDVTLSESKRRGNSRTKSKFSQAEDHLIALGLEQFKEVTKKNVYSHIRDLLVPVKSTEQIAMHVKNKKRHLNETKSSTGKCDETNPLTYYLKHGKLLPINRTLPQPKSSFSAFDKIPGWLSKQLDPQFTSPTKLKVFPRLKLSPVKGFYSLKYPKTASSPKKQNNLVVRRFRYLSKLPYIKPKPTLKTNNSTEITKTPEATVINLENAPLIISSPPLTNSQAPSPHQPLASQPSPHPTQPLSPSNTSPDQESPPLATSADQTCGMEEPIEIDVMEPVEEVVLSGTFDEPDHYQLSSPGQLSTNLTSKADSPSNSCSVEKESELMILQNEDDDEMDLAALMVASSTITSNKGRNKSHDNAGGSASKKEAKKSLTTKHKESTVLLLSEEDWLLNDSNREQKEHIMVQCFISKVREALKSDEDYIQFLTYLSEFVKNKSSNTSETGTDSSGSIKDLYNRIEKLLQKVNAQSVMEDFVLLLNAFEAEECGKMYQYLHWRWYLSFIRKLEVYSAVEPNCIPRLHKTLIQLKSSDTPVNKQRLKAAVSKALSGHPYLMNEFSSLFLDDKPKDYLFANDEDYDNVVITNVKTAPVNAVAESESDGGIGSNTGLGPCTFADDEFENVSIDLSVEERKYGTNDCPCKLCHNHVTNPTHSNINIDSGNTSNPNQNPAPSITPVNATSTSSATITTTTTTTSTTTTNTNTTINTTTSTTMITQSTTTNAPPMRHCAACSLRFIGGKIYLQGPKKIQPAEVQYTPTRESRSTLAASSRSQQSNESTLQSTKHQTNQQTVIVPPISSIKSPITNQSTSGDSLDEKSWSFAEDKLLLEFCKAKVSSDNEANLIEIFTEIASKLNRTTDCVIERFNKLMELFKHESSTTNDVTDQPETNERSSNTDQLDDLHPTTIIEVISTDPN